MRHTTQGKCANCEIRWIWSGKPLVHDARCPECGESLIRTSYQLGWKTCHLHTLETYEVPAPAR